MIGVRIFKMGSSRNLTMLPATTQTSRYFTIHLGLGWPQSSFSCHIPIHPVICFWNHNIYWLTSNTLSGGSGLYLKHYYSAHIHLVSEAVSTFVEYCLLIFHNPWFLQYFRVSPEPSIDFKIDFVLRMCLEVPAIWMCRLTFYIKTSCSFCCNLDQSDLFTTIFYNY